MSSQIDHLVTHLFQSQDGAARDIVNIRKSARLLSIPVDPYGPPLADPLHEAEQGQVGAAGRTVYGEVTHDTDIDTIQVVIGVTHRLGPLFAGGIGLERLTAGSRFRGGIGWLRPVDR